MHNFTLEHLCSVSPGKESGVFHHPVEPIGISIFDKAGFKGLERMRRAFIRWLGVNPQNYHDRFGRWIFAEFHVKPKI